jgi:hypothetical protein
VDALREVCLNKKLCVLGWCGNSRLFVSEENNGDDIREGFISPFNPNQNLGEKFKPPKVPILKLPLGTLHTSLIGHFCPHCFQTCSKQRNTQVRTL